MKITEDAPNAGHLYAHRQSFTRAMEKMIKTGFIQKNYYCDERVRVYYTIVEGMAGE